MKKSEVKAALTRETELGLVGWLLKQPSQSHVIAQIKGADFLDPKRGAAFDIAMALADETGDVAPAKMRAGLVEKEVCTFEAAVGWMADAAMLAPMTPAAAASLVEELRVDALARRLKVLGKTIADIPDSPDAPTSHDGMLDFAEQVVNDSLKHEQGLRAHTMAELMDAEIRLLDQSAGGIVTGLPFGFSSIDALTCGAQPGDLIIVAARPSMGKSAFAGQVSSNWAMGDKDHIAAGLPVKLRPGVLCTLEMSGGSYVQRILCSRTDVDLQTRRRNTLRDSEYQRYVHEANALADSPLRIVDRPTLRLNEFRSVCRRLKAELDIEFIVVDYLQLMTGVRRKGDSREQEVSSISSGIKSVARELGVPAIVVAQLNRGNEQRADKRPQMSDLRESGTLEQDADVIILLHREEYYHVNDPDWSHQNPDKVGVAEVIIAKQRNGPVGTVKLKWDAKRATFYEDSGPGAQGQATFGQ